MRLTRKSAAANAGHLKDRDLFKQFYYDQEFLQIWNDYSSNIANSPLHEAEIVFACGAILKKDLSDYKGKFPLPLKF